MPIPRGSHPQSHDARIDIERHRRRAAERQFAEAIALLRRLTDDDPCQLDHHGYCQTHRLSEQPCVNAEALHLIAAWDADHPSPAEPGDGDAREQ